MAVFGYTRISPLKGRKSPEEQAAAIKHYADEQGLGDVDVRQEPPGMSRGTTKFFQRPQARWLLDNVQADDTVIVMRLEALGCDARNIAGTIKVFGKMNVKVIVLQFGQQPLDLSTTAGKVLAEVAAIVADTQSILVSERLAEGKQRRRDTGVYFDRFGYGRKKVIGPDGHPYVVWDEAQLRYIAEIAERLGNGEDAARIMIDFRRRKIRDHRDRPWGDIEPRNGTEVKGSLLEHFYKATRWFHRAAAEGELPPPWNELASLIPKRPGFTVEVRKKRLARRSKARRK